MFSVKLLWQFRRRKHRKVGFVLSLRMVVALLNKQ